MSTWKKIIGTQESEFRVGLAGPKLVKGTGGLEVKTAAGVLTDVKAGTFTGNGAALTDIAGASVTGQVANAAVADSALSVAGANVSGEVSFAATANAVAGANVSGQVANAASADVALTVAGANVTGEVAFAATANAVAGANVSGIVSLATTAYSVAGANVSGEVSFAATANAVAGANVSGVVALATTAYGVDGANVVGQVANAASADVALAVAGANVTGEVAFAATANAVAGANVSGQVANAASADVALTVAGANVTGQVSFAATANAVAGANVTGNVGAANIAYALSSDTANISILGGSAGQFLQTNGSGDVTWATVDSSSIQNGTSSVAIPVADGNIALTVDGTLIATVSNAAVTMTGNLDITGNVNVTGNLNYQNVTDMVVGDPLIFIGANNAADTFDLGFSASYVNGSTVHTGFARDATDGIWKLFDGVATEPTTTIDFAGGTLAGFQAGDANLAGTVITEGKISNGNGGGMELFSTDYAQLNYNDESWVWVDSSGVHFESAGGQADFDTSGNLILPHAAQMETLVVTTSSQLGDVANVEILGGSAGEVLSTDGAGALSWIPIPSTADALKTVIVPFQYNTSSGSSATIPAGAIIDEVRVIVDTAFDGTAVVAVGNSSSVDAYVATTDTLLSLADRFEFSQSAAALSADDYILVTVTGGGATVGSGRVIVSYSTPV